MSVHVRFRVGGESYAVPVENVLEVADLGELSPVPGAPRAILGVRNMRGQVLPVIDLATVFGVASDNGGRRLVIAEERGRRGGLAIDEVTDVGDLPEAVQEADSQFLAGTTLADGELVGVIDISSVFAAVERGVA
jgi:purine-binding chemotaxis protein CheW